MSRNYSVILGNLGNTRDRFCGGYKENPSTMQMLASAVQIPHVKGIELIGTWDVTPANADEMRKAFEDYDVKCVSIIPDLFADPIYAKGSYSNNDKAIQQKAIDNTRVMCEVAERMGCDLINIWPGQDGYDYLLAADYEQQREWFCQAVTTLAQEHPRLRFTLEYKPKEPRTHSYLARAADTLLLAHETGCKNVGVTIDTGHAFYAGEVVGESIILAKRAGDKLMHMHFNDNHATWDDDMIVGSVHTVCYIEMLYWLDRCGYEGYFSMDQYPYREDAAGAIQESIEWLVRFDEIVQEYRDAITELIQRSDPVETSRFLRKILL